MSGLKLVPLFGFCEKLPLIIEADLGGADLSVDSTANRRESTIAGTLEFLRAGGRRIHGDRLVLDVDRGPKLSGGILKIRF